MRIRAAGEAIGQARAQQALPDMPGDCRAQERSGVRAGDRLDVALLKTDAALARQNARGARCAEWYEDLKSGIEVQASVP